MDIVVFTKKDKIVVSRHTSLAQNILKCVCRQGSIPDPLGKLNVLRKLPSWTWGPRRGKEEHKREGKGGYGRAGEGNWPPKGWANAVAPGFVGWLCVWMLDAVALR